MSVRGSPAPILSAHGTWAALRVPSTHDYVFSAKAALAVAVALAIGFSQNLENPYWSALTVYVLIGQPEAGAIRSKAIFRLLGTLAGGVIAILLAILFASHVGALLIASILAILVTFYPKTLDRTPTNYTWFVAPLTIAVLAIAQAPLPGTIFMMAMNRMLEICLAILVVGLIDSVLLPRSAMPGFSHLIIDWHVRASTWAAAALSPDACQTTDARAARRLGFHKFAGLLTLLAAAGIQLPYDIVPVPPRRRDMRLLRLLVSHVVVHLAASNLWVEAARRTSNGLAAFELHPKAVRDWMLEGPALNNGAILGHAAQGLELSDRLLASSRENMGGTDFGRLLQATALLRLSELVRHYSRLEQSVFAVITGTRPDPELRRAARAAWPAWSTDYVLGLADTLPLAFALFLCSALWYFTAWTAAIFAMVFVCITLGFVLGTPDALRSTRGILLWVTIANALTLLYQFAILPRVTDFPLLLIVLAAAMIPFGLLAAMSPAGVLILANAFASLGLQNAYAADFGATLELALGSMAGCMISYGALHLFQFDRARFQARRLARALRNDVVDVARRHRLPTTDRFVSLSVDRMSLYFAVVDGMPTDDPLQREDMLTPFRAGANLLRLRAQEDHLPPIRQAVAEVRDAIAMEFAKRGAPDHRAILPYLDAALAAAIELPESTSRAEALAALIGLRLALTAPSPLMPSTAAGAA
ncbi:FUSC family protein [Sphingomonas trueperi]|uniref:FUSC family protein n=1 Tax=Sphingomonas trueperi TaxID=53317 RepID=UPI000EB297D3